MRGGDCGRTAYFFFSHFVCLFVYFNAKTLDVFQRHFTSAFKANASKRDEKTDMARACKKSMESEDRAEFRKHFIFIKLRIKTNSSESDHYYLLSIYALDRRCPIAWIQWSEPELNMMHHTKPYSKVNFIIFNGVFLTDNILK